MLCRAIPYEGQEPYIFLSYCHKDAEEVYPLLEQMVRDGYRIWYDDGNRPGDDWLENIAQHLNNCQIFIAIISKQSANSHNCRNEVNFAVEAEKKVIAIVLEEFSMPLGMRLQLGRTHFLKRNEFPSDRMLLGKLYDVEELRACRAKPGSLPMRQLEYSIPQQVTGKNKPLVEDFIESEQRYGRKFREQLPAQQAPAVVQTLPVEEKTEIKPAQPVGVEEKLPEQKPAFERMNEWKPVTENMPEEVLKAIVEPETEKAPEAEMVMEEEAVEEKDGKTDHNSLQKAETEEIPAKPCDTDALDNCETEYLKDMQLNDSIKQNDDPPEESRNIRKVFVVDTADTEAAADVTKLLVPVFEEDEDGTDPTVMNDSDEDRTLRASMQKEIVLIYLSGKKGYVIRSALTRIGRSEKRCDVIIRDNPYISSHHADIVYYEGHYYLKDADSINGTFINDEIMETGSKVLLSNPAVFRLYNEYFILITGEAAKRIVEEGTVYFLRNTQTQEIKLLFEDTLLLDRSHKWAGGTMGDLGISRKKHAAVHRMNNGLYLEDRACANGVFLNVRRLEENEKCRLESGDEITLGSTVLEVGIVTL